MITKVSFGQPYETFSITQEVESAGAVSYFNMQRNADRIVFTYELGEKDIVYGLGETMRGINKRGGRYVSFNKDEGDHRDTTPSLYSSHNFIIIDGTQHFGTFFDTPSKVIFEIDYEKSGQVKVICETCDMKVYSVEGESSYQITREFLQAIGRSYIPPLWAFGYGQSRFGYKKEADFREVIEGYEKAGIPLDYICMDIDYMQKYTDFTVNKKRFPDLKAFAAECKEKGIRLVPIVDAGVKIEPGNKVYEEGVKKGYFCLNKDGGYFKAGVWPGMTHFTDFFREDARIWFGNQYRFYTEQGIEGFWNDMNEPSIFYSEYTKGPKKLGFFLDMFGGEKRKEEKKQQLIEDYQSFYHQVDGRKVRHYEVHNAYGYFMTMATSNQLEKILDHRFLLFTRSSYIGAGRYGGIWTGDNHSCWEHLRQNVLQMPSLNMCGFLYAGADTGGFGGDASRELLLRWLAVSAFTPLMRNHSSCFTKPQECYAYERTEDFKEVISLRYRLIPYLYSEYMKAALRGDMFMKPLGFLYPEDEMARRVEDQLLVGESIMMTPIIEEGAVSRKVYLPEPMTMVKYSGGAFACSKAEPGEMTIEADYNEVVFFIRKGRLVPIGKAVMNTREIDFEHLTLLGDGKAYELYADDGMTREYSLENIRVLRP